jgi:hypothetical protein
LNNIPDDTRQRSSPCYTPEMSWFPWRNDAFLTNRWAIATIRQAVFGLAVSAQNRAAGFAAAASVALKRQVSEWSHLSAAGGNPTAGVPGWARGHARQPSQPPSRGGSQA